ncbi:hypothetical protein [Botrimarina hoheduenensis]|uniref:DUF4114 domain-containing protein n=1 Tax=Botrimarina hoheduenensis TaxID=2528000 RepID=A0A5C5VN28_9BACT|nr:hypothetical protein [Botrimarina hoheduenensis]TWT40064.1 hypothetical protein Pla111_34690 [Botrimarina hoheduenensis]
MPSFEKMFMKSDGKPIEYQGNTLVMGDDFPTEGTIRLRLVFEACNGEWRQGVCLKVLGEGIFSANGHESPYFTFWQDTAPPVVEFEVVGDVSDIDVKNVWDVGDGVMDSGHNGAAMIVEEIPNGRRYRCNDGYADDDFDDIIFHIERLE